MRDARTPELPIISLVIDPYLLYDPVRGIYETLLKQREVNKGMRAAFTNEAPSRITELEDLADRQSAAADLWIPLKGKLLTAMAELDEGRCCMTYAVASATSDALPSWARAVLDEESAETVAYAFRRWIER